VLDDPVQLRSGQDELRQEIARREQQRMEAVL
jgi:hypothetical protein